MDIVAALRHKDQLPLQLQRVEDAAAVMWRLSSAAADEIERLRALLAEVCPPGLQKVSADLDARIRSALAAKGENT